MKTIYLAGGCFWGMEKYFEQFPGILSTEVGYANGTGENPTYEEVKHGSGHAETVKIVFDEEILPVSRLLALYFDVIDPLSVNRQGGDAGVQYRTGIYYTDDSLLPAIEAAAGAVEKAVGAPLTVEIVPLVQFWPAEEYHQKYLDKNPGGYCHIPAEKLHLVGGKDRT